MTSRTLPQLLTVARQHLDVLRRSELADQQDAVADLMEDAYRLGSAISASPALASDPDWRRFVDETSSVVHEKFVNLAYHPATLVNRFHGGFESDEWVRLCIARSELQFFIELFRDTAIAEDVAAIDTSEIDELIRMKAKDEAYLLPGERPREIPVSHWWWWLPGAPPADRR